MKIKSDVAAAAVALLLAAMPLAADDLTDADRFLCAAEEVTGMLTAAVARPGLFVGAFGACTPLPVGAY